MCNSHCLRRTYPKNGGTILSEFFKGYGRYDLASRFSLTTKLLIIFSNVIVLFMGYGLTELFLAIIIIVFVMLIVEAIALNQMFATFKLRVRFNMQLYKSTVQFGGWSWLQVVFTTMVMQLDKFVIALFVGLETLTYYSIGLLIFKQLQQVFLAASNWLLPKVSAKSVMKENLQRLYSLAKRAYFIMIVMTMLGIFTVRNFAFKLWLGEETFSQSIDFIMAFVFMASLMALTYIPSVFMIGNGSVKQNTILDVGLKVVFIPTLIAGYQLGGSIGIVYGYISILLLYVPIQSIIARKKLFQTEVKIAPQDIFFVLPMLAFIPLLFLGNELLYSLIFFALTVVTALWVVVAYSNKPIAYQVEELKSLLKRKS
ncbi:oligosaccharide flippase family protein [bacterium SCSIO 12741]|nr:oligosaccharide flippase family protein [bacterium SCSIO 12741]